MVTCHYNVTRHTRSTTMATEAQLTDRIQRIKAALLALGDLRPGALSEQYNTCRTPGCRCKADPPQRHGPYHQLSYSHHGKESHREHPPRTHHHGHLPDRQLPQAARPHRPMDRHRHRTGPPPTPPTPIAATTPPPAPLHFKPTRAIQLRRSNPSNTGPSGPSMPIQHALTLG